MPGTHYDNDHSFIDVLPFELKHAAYLMLRQDALATILNNLATNQSPIFEQNPSPYFTDERKQQILQACIVAKITSFDKTLFINADHQTFLNQTLNAALHFLARHALAGSDHSDAALQAYLKISHPRTYHWLKRSDLESRHRLAIRPRYKNTRRYFRYKAKIKYHFIRIGSHEGVVELQGDIYTNGIQHFTEIVNEKLDRLTQDYHLNIEKALASSFPQAYQLFMVVIKQMEYLRDVLSGISIGIIPIADAKATLRKALQNRLDYAALSGNIRTESLLRDFEAKIDQISSHTLTLLEKSTPHQLYQGPILQQLKIDNEIDSYKEKRKKNSSCLLTSFIDLYEYAQQLERIYNNISASNFIIIFPEYWSEDYYNASPGGFSFHSEFLVNLNDILEVFLQIDTSPDANKNSDQMLHQRVKVVRIDKVVEQGVYRISCQFLAPEEETMNLIRKSLQSQEIIDAFDAAAFIDE
ncbi:hypothetical protein THMIRHAS_14690 [Thiosulfatimonas sediminis]|uniref:PilZ domain-containing protein n=1 Tax=Thiosulfatimonas sediminis TaxID=2675054 RepID=A0A6F8PVH1_9GAMM|nr:PilZ domain-containing protein [Thiosulfatimonas sediminis]BBP46096.1 hypothetical protein THMIRHAS_14690 [Thiosulfatimonas sediminis]